MPGMEKAAGVAPLKKFDKNLGFGRICCGRCKAIFWVEDGTGERVSLLLKDRCKGLCEDCIEEVRPTKKLRLRKDVVMWFARMNRQLMKWEEEEFGEH